MAEIVVVGSLNIDLVVRVARLPQPGETVPGGDVQTIPGGKGANQAAAAARLGGQVALVGCVGNDAFGMRLIDNLAAQQVDTARVRVDDGAPTGMALILVDECGENSIVVSAGANGRLSRRDLDAAEALLARARLLLLQLEVPLDSVAYALALARRHGVQTVLNPAPAQALPRDLLAQVDCLVPNETEASQLTGMAVHDPHSAAAAAQQLRSWGVGAVIVTLGGQGALLADGRQVMHVPAPAVQVMDTTAAGDAFIGGLSVALVSGRPLEEAVRYAVCAGALAVTRFGAQTSLPSAEEVAALYVQTGFVGRGALNP